MDEREQATRVHAFFAAARTRTPLDEATRLSLADEADGLLQAIGRPVAPGHGAALHAFVASLLIDLPGGRTPAQLQRIRGHLDAAAACAESLGSQAVEHELVSLRASAHIRTGEAVPEELLDEAIQSCLHALSLPGAADDAQLAGPLAFGAGRFLVRRDGWPGNPGEAEVLEHLFGLALRSYRATGREAAAHDAARHLQRIAEARPAAAPSAPAAPVPAPQIDRLLGRAWALLGTMPMELSPRDDPPPFPSQMISVNVLPQVLAAEAALQMLEHGLQALMWSGSLQGRVAARTHRCAVLRVAGNPLTGEMLMVARTFALPQATALLIYETTDAVWVAREDEVVAAIDGLAWPLWTDAAAPGPAATAGPGAALPHLSAALAGTPMAQPLQQALQLQDLGMRYGELSLMAAHLLRSPAFVEGLQAPAYREFVRLLEGVSSTFTRVRHDGLQFFAVSLLARGLLLHPEASDEATQRALHLSELLMARTQGTHRHRWEEALLTHLLARAARAARSGSEDYGNLSALAQAMSSQRGAARRVLARLVSDGTFSLANRFDPYSHFRLARCDMAVSLMQAMTLEHPGSGFTPMAQMQEPPPEFVLRGPEEPAEEEDASFFDVYLIASDAAFQEMQRLYRVDAAAAREAAMAHLAEVWPEDQRPGLLFLRGFRSARRVWIDSRAEVRSRHVLPWSGRSTRLSFEAALVHFLGSFSHTALGGLPDPLGMARLGTAFDDATWRVGFEINTRLAATILVLPDVSDALTWEIGQLVEQSLLDKTVWAMIPLTLDAKAHEVWRHTAGTLAAHGIALPPYDAGGGFVLMTEGGRSSETLDFESLTEGRLVERLLQRLGLGGVR